MAEVKNSFTSSKMNQDLDDRLIPSNEYRTAKNISIISSDSSNTGAIENILGNKLLLDIKGTMISPSIIGYIVDPTSNLLYAMVTNYTDVSPTKLTIPLSYTEYSPEHINCNIVRVNLSNNTFAILVQGAFLNFSTTHPITGINLVENLLFWTDNRNQPRKINVTTAYNNATYYTTEDQISVAKYAPIDSIVFIDNQGNLTMKDVTSATLPNGTANPYYDVTSPVDPAYTKGKFIRFSYRFRFDDGEYSIFAPFSQIAFIPQQDGSFLNGDEDATYRSSIVAFMKNKVNQIGLIVPFPTTGSKLFDSFKITEIDILYKESDSLAVQVLDTITPGSDYVDGFAYKPNEIANVTGTGTGWTLFTPTVGNLNYNGYTHGSGTTALTTSLAAIYSVSFTTTYQVNWTIIGATAGTVTISFGGVIITPSTLGGVSISGKQSLTTTSTGVLTITPTTTFNGRVVISIIPKVSTTLKPYISNTNSFYSYTYQSRKPKTTLPNDQLIRVYDKVPVRALAQESSGGRIIYGNYIDKHTPPRTLDYNVRLSDKGTAVKTEYPLHTVKQNRNYQVGIILSDRYGRQSDVILSTINDGSVAESVNFGGSSFYAPYRTSSDSTNVLNFVGNSIKILFNSVITSNFSPLNDLGIPATGEPGLYDIGGKLLRASVANQNTSPVSAPGTYTNVPVYNNGFDSGARVTITVITGGEIIDPIIVTNGGNGGLEYASEVALGGVGIGATIVVEQISKANPLGWYSYKVVVKQTQQEYYNVYLPGILNAYPGAETLATPFPTGETDKTSHTVLFGDNINKVPRDLSEVGPDQKQYRSSVRLFGRVQNTYISSATNNAQFFPTSIEGFSISTLGNANDLGMTSAALTALGEGNLYQFSTNPIVSRISTNGQAFGVVSATMVPYLAIAETDPVVSNLDIYWETSTTGLISDLNTLIGQNNVGAYAFFNVNYLQYEGQNPNGSGTDPGALTSPYVTDWFYPVDYTGQPLTTPIVTLANVKTANDIDISSKFSLVNSGYTWKIKISAVAGNEFLYNPIINENQFIFTFNIVASGVSNQLIINGSLNNNSPIITTYTLNQVYSGIPINYQITNTALGKNGSYSSATNLLGLTWSFDDGTSVKTFGTSPNTFTLTINASGIITLSSGTPIELITLNIKLTDSGGLSVLQPISLDFRQGEFSPTQFNLDFNL